MKSIDAHTLHGWQVEQRDFVLLDTLPATAYQKSHLPGALHLVSDDILALAPARLPDKDRTIVVYCASPRCKRAGLAAERLDRLGYRRVFHFPGGKQEWQAASFPLEADAVDHAG